MACKMLESVVQDAVATHMTVNDIFSDPKFGFMQGRSCMLQLLAVLEEWTEIVDMGV